MSDDFWSSQNLRDFIIGLGGGFSGAFSLRKVEVWDLFRHVIVGGLTAVWCGPDISAKLGTPHDLTLWCVGCGGIGICQGAIKFFEWWSPLKRMKND